MPKRKGTDPGATWLPTRIYPGGGWALVSLGPLAPIGVYIALAELGAGMDRGWNGSVRQLHDELKRHGSGVGRGSVQRSVDALVRSGVLSIDAKGKYYVFRLSPVDRSIAHRRGPNQSHHVNVKHGGPNQSQCGPNQSHTGPNQSQTITRAKEKREGRGYASKHIPLPSYEVGKNAATGAPPSGGGTPAALDGQQQEPRRQDPTTAQAIAATTPEMREEGQRMAETFLAPSPKPSGPPKELKRALAAFKAGDLGAMAAELAKARRDAAEHTADELAMCRGDLTHDYSDPSYLDMARKERARLSAATDSAKANGAAVGRAKAAKRVRG